MKPKEMEILVTAPLKNKYHPPKSIRKEHNEIISKMGQKLQELRRKKGISSSGFAKEVGISRNGYHQMENGKVYFNIMTLMQILDYYKLSLIDFINDL
jgi:DNA-binding XRE family transcriptional regulator